MNSPKYLFIFADIPQKSWFCQKKGNFIQNKFIFLTLHIVKLDNLKQNRYQNAQYLIYWCLKKAWFCLIWGIYERFGKDGQLLKTHSFKINLDVTKWSHQSRGNWPQAHWKIHQRINHWVEKIWILIYDTITHMSLQPKWNLQERKNSVPTYPTSSGPL